MISRAERGHLGTLTLETTRRICAALEVRVELAPRWRAGELDRLLNTRHSAFHEAMARHLSTLPDWVAEPEVSFSIYGERGVIDILAYHPGRRALLLIELKTEVVDVQELVSTMDRRRRLARSIAAERGWPVDTVSVWVAIAEGSTNRARVAAHRTFLASAFPAGGRAMRSWLRDPSGEIRCLSFFQYALPRHVTKRGAGAERVRAVRRPAA